MKYTAVEITDMVGRYLRGEMLGKQLEEFKEILGSNKLFQEELSLQENLQKAFRKRAHKDLKSTFQSIEKEKYDSENHLASQRNDEKNRRPLMLILVLGFLLIGATIFYLISSRSTEPAQLFAEAMSPFPNSYLEVERSNSSQKNSSNLEKGFLAYDAGKYDKAQQYLVNITGDKQVDFYRAVCLLQSGDSQSSRSILSQLYEMKSHPEFEAVRWYYGLSLLSLKETAKAKEIFQEIIDTQQIYQKSQTIYILDQLR